MSKWQLIPTSLLFLFRKPVRGEEWGYIRRRTNPWEEDSIYSVFVKDVKDGWVCYTRNRDLATNYPCNQWEDDFSRISDFKENYAPVDWLKTQL